MPTIADCSIEELREEVAAHAAHLSAGMCRYLELVAECDRRGEWEEWGTTVEWLAWRCNLTRRTAREHVRVACALDDLPLIQTAFGRGELSYAKVRALTRVGRPEHEDELLQLAFDLTGSQLELALRTYRRVGRLEALRVQAAETLSYFWDDDGSLVVSGRLAPEDGAVFVKALEVAKERLWSERQPVEEIDGAEAECGSAEPPAARARPSNVEALLAVADAALAHEGASRPDAERYQVVIHVEEEALRDDGDGVSVLADGPPLAPETVCRLACDASIVTLLERAGEPLGVGRKTRKIPLRLRRALEARDGCCRFPGCTSRRVQAHHIRHWTQGGETELWNLVLLCHRHHRLVHEGGWTVDHQLCFHDFRGEPVLDVPPQPPGSLTALQAANEELGISATSVRTAYGDPMDLTMAVDHLLRVAGRPPAWSTIAEEVAEGLSERLVGRTHGPHTIEGVVQFGAVDIHPGRLVVRLLIGGTTDHALPWDPDWVEALREEVIAAFDEREWPSFAAMEFRLESSERLRAWAAPSSD